jgi:hypothetical protein
MSARKTNLYDLRLDWRKSRFSSVSPLTPIAIDGFDTRAVADNHRWATVRQVGTFSFLLRATERLHLIFDYDRMENTGAQQSTRALEFVGAPATWGAFARANPYLVLSPVDSKASRVTGGTSYSGSTWSVHYKAGYQVTDENRSFDILTSPERSINTADATTANELLTMLGWTEHRRLTAPSSQFTYVSRPSPTVELRGDYLYYRHRGPFSLDAAFQGSARTTGTAVSPYAVAVTDRGRVREDSHVLGQGFTYRPRDAWMLDVMYRYSRSTLDGTGHYASSLALYPVLAAIPVTTALDEEVGWGDRIHTLDVRTTFVPTAELTIQPGLRFTKRDIERTIDGAIDTSATQRQNIARPEISVGYQPLPILSVRGSFKSTYGDAAYTRLSPIRRTSTHAVVRLDPVATLSIEGDLDVTNAERVEAGFKSRLRGFAARVSYAPTDRYSVFGGYDRRSFSASGNGTFLRGTAPITGLLLLDREIDHVWHAGAAVNPTSRLGLTFSLNYNRTTGLDTIAGEPPLYGPTTFPYGTGTIFFNLPQAGRLSLDVQRTYLQQELLPINDFSASLVTIRFSRSF